MTMINGMLLCKKENIYRKIKKINIIKKYIKYQHYHCINLLNKCIIKNLIVQNLKFS